MECLVYLLSEWFAEPALIKPQNSRICNSEKYFVGKNFKGLEFIDPKHLSVLKECIETSSTLNLRTMVSVPNLFKLNLRHFNSQFAHMQNTFLTTALSIVQYLKQEGKTSIKDMEVIVYNFQNDEIPVATAKAYCLTYNLPMKGD